MRTLLTKQMVHQHYYPVPWEPLICQKSSVRAVRKTVFSFVMMHCHAKTLSSRKMCLNYWKKSFFFSCYDQGLGETLVQHENEAPLFLSPKHHQQQSIFKCFFFFQKHIFAHNQACWQSGWQRRAPRNCEELALKLLASRQEPISSLDNLKSLQHTCNQSRSQSHRVLLKQRQTIETFMTSRVVTYHNTHTKSAGSDS